MTKTDMTVANEILRQLGGMKNLIIMTGSREFSGTANSLSFKLGTGAKGTHIRIVLDPSDTYSVTLYKIRAKTVKEVAKEEMIYCDMLVDTFERQTGFHLSF